jgi:lipoprotein NlpI
VSGIPNLSWALYLLSAQTTNDQAQAFTQIKAKLTAFPKDLWPVQLIRLVSDDVSIAEAMKAQEEESPRLMKQRKGEASYLAGEIALKRGDIGSADKCFRQAMELCSPCSPAYGFAHFRLRQQTRKTLRPQ